MKSEPRLAREALIKTTIGTTMQSLVQHVGHEHALEWADVHVGGEAGHGEDEKGEWDLPVTPDRLIPSEEHCDGQE
jgi:hypothetical protein